MTASSPVVEGIALTRRTFEAAGRRIGLWVPVDPDKPFYALTQNEFAVTDERLPYFTMVGASAEALAGGSSRTRAWTAER